ncbi:hypothetical protein [uncultured Paludibaculum sp.]|uniref:hypothetical protein n=1 Tax=uncultured Paludibaculum sp. TaxID=1765020 RepID=UPI002AAAE805|nr:hypothetical protein [uncultured Paludibaculum sp.]
MATSSNPMAEPTVVLPAAESGLSSAKPGGWSRWLCPSLFDLLFVSLPFWFFGLADGGTGLLLFDGDTGWHIRTGDWILTHRQFVMGDIFSFTKAGQPWFAWEWLSDILFSLMHSAAGMKGILLFGILFSALFCGLIFRHMVWRGANMFIALPLALMGFGSATVHLLARPHLWTLLLVAACGWLIQADLRKPTRWIWALIPVTVVWTNLHGGWLSLIAILGLVAVGTGLEARFGGAEWSTAKRYLALAAACLASSVVNPYGWRLHAHMVEYLRADWIKNMISEFQSPTFRSENAMQFELILLASLVAAGWALRRKQFVGPLLILFWAHSSLVSARHIPIFVAVALPFLADELQRFWLTWTSGATRKSTLGILQGLASEAQPGLRRTSVWAAIPFILIALPILPLPWPTDFPGVRFPTKMVATHADLLRSSRVATEDQWADYLIYRFYPEQKVFFDGRSDFYGEALTKEYVQFMGAESNWKSVMEKYGFTVALLKVQSPLSTVLKESGAWRVVDDDGKAIVFERRGQKVVRAVGKGMENTDSGANENP